MRRGRTRVRARDSLDGEVDDHKVDRDARVGAIPEPRRLGREEELRQVRPHPAGRGWAIADDNDPILLAVEPRRSEGLCEDDDSGLVLGLGQRKGAHRVSPAAPLTRKRDLTPVSCAARSAHDSCLKFPPLGYFQPPEIIDKIVVGHGWAAKFCWNFCPRRSTHEELAGTSFSAWPEPRGSPQPLLHLLRPLVSLLASLLISLLVSLLLGRRSAVRRGSLLGRSMCIS